MKSKDIKNNMESYYNNERRKESITSKMHDISSDLINKIGDADMLCIGDDYIVIKDHQDNTHFDLTRLKKDHPDVFMACSKAYYKKGVIVTKIDRVDDVAKDTDKNQEKSSMKETNNGHTKLRKKLVRGNTSNE